MARDKEVTVHALDRATGEPVDKAYFEGNKGKRIFIRPADEYDESVALQINLEIAKLYVRESDEIINLICVQAMPYLVPFDNESHARKACKRINRLAEISRHA